MAAAMTRLATMDPAERKRLEEQGKAWAARFTWSAHAAEVAKIYQQSMTKGMLD